MDSWKEYLSLLLPILTAVGAIFAYVHRHFGRQQIREERKAKEQANILADFYKEWHQKLQEQAVEAHRELRKEVHDWRDEAQKLTNEAAKLRGEVETLRRDRRDADRELAEMRQRHDQELRDLRRQLEEKEKELHTSRGRITELEQQVNELKRVNSQERGINDVG